MEHQRPLPRLPLVARLFPPDTDPLPPRRRSARHGLRVPAGPQQKLRSAPSRAFSHRYVLPASKGSSPPLLIPPDAPLIYRDHPEEEEDDEEGGGDDEESSRAVAVGLRGPAARRAHIAKALFYAVQVFYSFFIMLLFMTYNGWVMLAVAVGAFLGFVLWGGKGEATKSVACH